ncbi:HdeD family acid-resistance protein [Actinoplanes sp. CA-252034]|uniref:HdeD family acid-resistance protein n=1 Tax=Actinoplanes sp. CA-252034 TaxID=3239906 RepID=UPI003D95B690
MSRTWTWLRLAAGVLAVGVGILAFAWPQATLRVVAFLFGLNLLIAGGIRILQMFVADGLPALHRVAGILLGLLVAGAGIVCLADVTRSLSLMLLIVAIGWLFDGIGEIFLSLGRRSAGGGWRIVVGLFAVLGALALLIWPGLGLAGFVLVGATTLVFGGICLIAASIAGLRQPEPAVDRG